jgi:hypothetical protein
MTDNSKPHGPNNYCLQCTSGEDGEWSGCRAEKTAIGAVHPEAKGFVECVTPVKPPADVFFFKCDCGSIHYRHAGYVKTMSPFMRQGGEKKVGIDKQMVMICVACKKSYAWINEQMYDLSAQIDVKAWEKTEKEMHAATGPGGEC